MSARLDSIRLVQGYDDATGYAQIVAHIEADTAADAPARTDFVGYYLMSGSTMHDIAENTIYCMNSAGTWYIQDEASRMDVYTKAQTDDAIAAAILPEHEEIDNLGVIQKSILKRIGQNLANWSANTQTITDVTFTVDQDARTVSTSGTAAARRQKALNLTFLSNPGFDRYILKGTPSGGEVGGSVKYCMYIWDNTASARVSQNDTGDGIEFEWTPDITHSYNITIDIRAGTNANGLTFMPMIYRVDDNFRQPYYVPYIPSNSDLLALIRSYHPT